MPNADSRLLADPARLAALGRTGLLDAPTDASLERLTRLTARLLGVPTALVTLVDGERQFFAASTGLHEDLARARQTSLDYSFCQHVVAGAAPFVVRDAAVHPLVSDNPARSTYDVVAYAGMPLRSADGHMLGSFCAMDTQARQWSQEDLDALQDLARAAMTEIELRQAARLLEEQGEQLHSLLESTRELVGQFTPDGGVQYVNAAFRWTIGEPPATGAGDWFRDLLDQPSRVAFEDARSAALRHGQERLVALRVLPPGLAPVELRARMLPIRKDGALSAVRFLADDVTEANRVERAKDQLIGVVSHELRTPIGAVQGALSLLGRLLPAEVAPKAQDLLGLASRNAARLLFLVNDLLDLERLEAGQLPLERRETTVADIFAIARDATAPQAEARGIALSWHPTETTLSVDADRLARVLINLVGNALKFTPAGKSVEVRSTVVGPQWRCAVRDEGRGIPPDAIERVFERFSQVERGDATEKGGTGLGLAIARAIVLAHGGRIGLESTVGQGSTFWLELPLQAAVEGR